jgi:2',3'-cyclic-nucleotide 2'-phosphodiesterase (5'-nucleotidase family)
MIRIEGMRRVCAAGMLAAALAAAGCGGGGGEKRGAAKPDELTVLFSSDLLGKIRSCGCAVEDMGGVGRRATYTDRARASVRNLIAVDAGDIMTPDLSFSKAEAELAFDALNVMKLDAVTPGEADFVFGLPFLQMLASRLTMPVVAANLVDPATGERIFAAYTVRTLAGGLRVGITGVIDEGIKFPTYIDASGFSVLGAEETLRKLLPELERETDFLILLSHMGLERSTALAKRLGGFDLVVVGHGKPVLKKLERQGAAIMLATGGEGQYLGRVDLSLSASGEIVEGSMRLVPLEDAIEVHPGVKDLFTQYGLELTEKERDKKR